MKRSDVDDLLCAIVRGESPGWPAEGSDDLEALLLRHAEYHGIVALLDERLAHLSAWPTSFLDAVHRSAIAQALWEMRNKKVIGEVLTALEKRGIEPVLFKGTALAYSLYANSTWRPRADTDMIIASSDAGPTIETLTSLGFARHASIDGELVSYQDSFVKATGIGGSHVIDIHRRITNSELLSRLLTYAELRGEARALPALCCAALAAGPVHALLLACLHRATHRHNPYYTDGVAYYGGDRLIWYYDIHLLAQSFTVPDWQAFIREATEKGLCATSVEGLTGATVRFGTRCPDFASDALARTGEPVTTYLGASRLRQSWIDFWAIPSVAKRLQFAHELMFPPAIYMRTKYKASDKTWLPWLYARRAVEVSGDLLLKIHPQIVCQLRPSDQLPNRMNTGFPRCFCISETH